ncbi:MAG: DUF2971 domain-containing protein [Myxococcaceae bacterium]
MVARLHGTGEPRDLNATLWRFMDFTKYVAMLREGALYFTRADQLPDPYEGRREAGRLLQEPQEDDRLHRSVFLSCWHQNEKESAAMWRIYLGSDEGVAIKTSVEQLRHSLAATPVRLHVGKVAYLDEPPERDELDPFFTKRQSFDYERELRVLWRSERESDERGRYLPADLEALVSQVVVPPGASHWFEDLVRSVTGKYGYNFTVGASSTLQAPSPRRVSWDVEGPEDRAEHHVTQQH